GVLLFLTEPVQYLPKGVLGAIIVFAAIGLIEPSAWRALARIDAVEVAIAGVTTGCVIAFGVLQALIVAVGLSMIATVRPSARAPAGRGARMGAVARPLRRRGLASECRHHAGCRGVPVGRSIVLRQRRLRHRARPGGFAGRAVSRRVVGLRRRGDDSRGRHRT